MRKLIISILFSFLFCGTALAGLFIPRSVRFDNPNQVFSYRERELSTSRVYTVHVVGTGSGFFRVTSMASIGAVAGDVISITPGTYTDWCQLYGLDSVTVNAYNNGIVYISGAAAWLDIAKGGSGKGFHNVNFDFSSSSTTYGLVFFGAIHGGVPMSAGFADCLFKGWKFQDTHTNCFSIGSAVVTMDTITMKNKAVVRCTYQHIWAVNCGGLWDNFKDWYVNVMDSCEWSDIIVDSANGLSPFVLGATYASKFHDITILPYNTTDRVDGGFFTVYGTCQIYNITRFEASWGWLMRIFGRSIHSNDTMALYNIRNIGGANYGVADCRTDNSVLSSIHLFNNPLYCFNITAGNMRSGWIAPTLLNYGRLGTPVYFYNNFRFNSQNSPGGYNDTLSYISFSPPADENTIYRNSIYKTSFSGYLQDTLSCAIVPSSPLAYAGNAGSLSFSGGTKDFNGNVRPSPGHSTPSIGYVEPLAVLPPCQSCSPKVRGAKLYVK